jgi:hypothetical protein
MEKALRGYLPQNKKIGVRVQFSGLILKPPTLSGELGGTFKIENLTAFQQGRADYGRKGGRKGVERGIPRGRV